MNRIIGRPGRLLMPAAIALCALAGAEARAAALALAIIVARICSLCGGEGLRAAAARVVNGPRLNGNFYLALAMGVLGGILATALWLAPASPMHGVIPPETAVTGALIMLAQLAADGIYAMPDAKSGGAGDAIIALFTAAGLLISGGNGALMVAAGGICALAVMGLSFALRPKLRFRSGFRALLCTPSALVRMGVPCVLLALLLYIRPEWAPVHCLAWGVFDAMEAPIRRSRPESCYVNLAAVIPGAVAAAAAVLVPGALTSQIAAAAFIACGALIAFSSHIDPRSLGLLAALALALWAGWEYCTGSWGAAPRPLLFWGALVLAMAALAAAIPDFSDALRRSRAAVIMKKRHA
jgi:hypothetical protein